MPVLIGDSGTGDDKRFKVILRSESEYFTILGGEPKDLHHDLSLKIVNLTKTSLMTEETYSYSLVLINNGDHPEYLTVDGNSLNFVSAGSGSEHSSLFKPSCTLSGSGGITYASYFIHENPLMAGFKLIIQDSILSGAPKWPGIYNFSGAVMVSIADEPMAGKSEDDGIRASCVDPYIDPIMFNVTAPAYDGVRLVLGSDKEKYTPEEVVHFSLFIENVSDKPFVLTEDEPSINVRSSNGTDVFNISYVADIVGPVTVKPHSIYRLDDVSQLVWNLTNPDQEPSETKASKARVIPGLYFVHATFTYPYLESKTLEITILDR